MRGTSPIHRLSATGGLIALVPVAVLVFQERLTLLEAGTRGLAILVAVLVLRWITDRTVRNLASGLGGTERRLDTSADSEGDSRSGAAPVAG